MRALQFHFPSFLQPQRHSLRYPFLRNLHMTEKRSEPYEQKEEPILPPIKKRKIDNHGGCPIVVGDIVADDVQDGGESRVTPNIQPSVGVCDVSESKSFFSPYDKLPNEADVGIETYLDKKRPGFIAYFKQRFTDFIVREVTTKGTVVKLTDLNTLPEFDRLSEAQAMDVITEEQMLKTFTELLGERETAEKLMEYGNLEKDNSGRKNTFFISGKISEDKDLRTKFHENVRRFFHGELQSETIVEGNSRVIEVFFPEAKNGKAIKKIQNWPKVKPPYLQFVLYKENTDTTAALDALARSIGVRPGMFTTAGTKDKRAVTTQLVTAYKIEAGRVRNTNYRRLYGAAIKVGNFEYVDHPLKLGDLGGNHFTITLRGVDASDDLLTEACESVKKYGFINYFGTQRFGTGTIPTHHVGRLLLQSKWPEAIHLLLAPRAFEKPDVTDARIYYQKTKDIDGTLNRLPKYHVIEHTLLRAIKKYGENLNAFSQLPINMRLLYVHSYQSYIWNKIASKRIDLALSPMELMPIVGDLVFEKTLGEYIYVTEENLRNYSITDVCLPMPGYSVKYPKNEIFSFLKNLMSEDGLDPDDMKRNQHLFSLPGGYRPLLRKPLDFNYYISHYDDLRASLTLTDLEILEKTPEPIHSSKGAYTAVVIDMTLDSATYATMVIRELTKNPTSQIYQRELQKKFDSEHDKEETETETDHLQENLLE